MELAVALTDDQLKNYISDQLTFNDKISGGLQVVALADPGAFLARWRTFIDDAVNTVYPTNGPNGFNYGTHFSEYLGDLGFPTTSLNAARAHFTKFVVNSFIEKLGLGKMATLAKEKLEKSSRVI